MITRSHPLYDAGLKSGRAKVHLDSLKAEVANFKNNPKPYSEVFEVDGKKRLHTQWPPPIPDSWGLILSDFATNLRATLDYIASELTAKGLTDIGSSRQPSRKTAFPICDEPRLSETDERIADILPAAFTEIERMQPYHKEERPETHLLSILRELSNTTKHRFIISPGVTTRLVTPPGGHVALVLGPDQLTICASGKEAVPYTNANPYVSLIVHIEVPKLTPSLHEISALDDLHRFVSNEVLPRFECFF